MSDQYYRLFTEPVLASDYTAGAHPALLRALNRTNLLHTPGYGTDYFSEQARRRIRRAVGNPRADIYFLVGGTQTNALSLRALLKPHQGVLAAESGHISVHEAGAVELGGHKILALPARDGKISGRDVLDYCRRFYEDETYPHMVCPGGIYISQPTELGTLYSLAELKALRAAADEFGLFLYVDGARLAYGLACPENDVSLKDLGALCDAFYIGGTKCGALFGEALVLKNNKLCPAMLTLIKQQGAMLAKGRLSGVQFGRLFYRDLYGEIGRKGMEMAALLKEGLKKKGYDFYLNSPTNQIFITVTDAVWARLKAQGLGGFWSREKAGFTNVRFVCSWDTSPEDIRRVLEAL